MRQVSSTMEERLNSQVQTIAENANPATYFRMMRHEIPLAEKQYLEYSRVGRTNGITDSDVAVCHPRFGKPDEDIWVSYIVNNKLKVRYADNVEALSKSDWIEYSYTPDAIACSIAFDSEAKHDARGIWEFVTEKYPWVFWVTPDGALRAKMCTPVGVMEIELANASVTDVSAVRGPAGEYGNWNLGLTVFFLMNGNIFYRQYIDGEWYDAELVQHEGLQGLTISKIKAFNTWDYRVGLQILTSDNKLYELFSYSEGIGTRGTEHLEIGVSAEGHLFRVQYNDGYLNEHLEMDVSVQSARIYGLSTIPVSARNIEVNGDWGRKVEVAMNYPNSAGSTSEFMLRDSNGNLYACENIEFDDKIIRLTFVNFNMAYTADECEVVYTKGTLMSPVVLTNSFSISFEPTGLASPTTPPPSVASIYNL